MLPRCLIRPSAVAALLPFLAAACGVQPIAMRSIDEPAAPDFEGSVALLRLTGSVGGRPAAVRLASHAPATADAPAAPSVSVELAVTSAWADLPMLMKPSPDAAVTTADASGWRYLELPPGDFVLTISGTGWTHTHRLGFAMPVKRSAAYIGSFHLACPQAVTASNCVPRVAYRREVDAAKAVVAGAFPHLPLAMAETVPYGHTLAVPALDAISPLALTTGDDDALTPPSWWRFSQDDTPKVASTGSGGRELDCSGVGAEGCVVILMAVLAVVGTIAIGKATVNAVQLAVDMRRWGPCVEKLAETLRETAPAPTCADVSLGACHDF